MHVSPTFPPWTVTLSPDTDTPTLGPFFVSSCVNGRQRPITFIAIDSG